VNRWVPRSPTTRGALRSEGMKKIIFLLVLLAAAAAFAGTKRKDDVRAGAARAQSTLADAAKTAKEKVKPSTGTADDFAAAVDGEVADVVRV
jgi:hypothetical protein